MEKQLPSPTITPELEAKFWAKVDKSEGHGPDGDCWVWTAGFGNGGYPTGIAWEGHTYRATHIALAIDGKPRPDELHALHRCDHKPCVRPDHLRWGTQQDNTKDYVARGNAKRAFTPEQIREIRGSDEANAVIAKRYGVLTSSIYAVRKGVIYKHVA